MSTVRKVPKLIRKEEWRREKASEVKEIGNDRFNGEAVMMMKLPLLHLKGIVLFPGLKLPHRVLEQQLNVAVHHTMDPVANDALQALGVIHVRISRNGRIHVAKYANFRTIAKV